jgi:hypothetical protein
MVGRASCKVELRWILSFMIDDILQVLNMIEKDLYLRFIIIRCARSIDSSSLHHSDHNAFAAMIPE